MPRKPLGPCASPGCPGRARNGRYCPGHAHLNRQQRKPDNRPSASQRGYDAKWRRIRGLYLQHHPYCSNAWCDEDATEVDHIVPLVQGGTHQWSNLQAFCKSCHSSKTARFDGGLGNPREGG